MESDNWIVQNLQSALNTWNDKLNEIWTLLTQDPATFKGGSIWSVMTSINGALKAIALGLLVLFFAMGIIKTCSSFTDMKKPEHVLKAFIRFALAQGAVVYGMDLMKALFSIIQGIVTTILANANLSGGTVSQLPAEIVEKVESVGMLDSIPLWIVTLLGSLLITVLSFIMILTVYGRMFKLYMYTAIAPIPLSTFAGEPSQSVGKNFIRSYAGVCLEGAIIALACIIFSVFTSSMPAVSDISLSAVTIVWNYVGELAQILPEREIPLYLIHYVLETFHGLLKQWASKIRKKNPAFTYMPAKNPLVYEELMGENYLFSRDALRQAMFSSLYCICDELKESRSTSDIMLQIAQYMELNYTKPFIQSEYAKLFYINKDYMSRKFTSTFHVNMLTYLNQIRIRHARELLSDFSLKIQDIAYAVGFKDEKYFAKQFKKLTNTTPGDYRAALRKEKGQGY